MGTCSTRRCRERKLIDLIDQIDLNEQTLHIAAPKTDPHDPGYWGGLQLQTDQTHPAVPPRLTYIYNYHKVDILECHVTDNDECIWTFIDRDNNDDYVKYQDTAIHHLGGAFFAFETPQQQQPRQHCQMVLEEGKYEIICEPSLRGSRSAFEHEDLINYNVFMHAKYPQEIRDPYIYFAGKQKCNHCVLFALNNAFGWDVFDTHKFAKLHIMENKKFDFAEHPKTKELVPEEFSKRVTQQALMKMGMSLKSEHSISLVGGTYTHYIQSLDRDPVQNGGELGWFWIHTGAYHPKRKPNDVSTESHAFVFKYIARNWWGFDANMKRPNGPYSRFSGCFKDTVSKHNVHFAGRAFKIDGNRILNGGGIHGDNWKLGRAIQIIPYQPQYSQYIDYNDHFIYDNNNYGNFAQLFLQYGLLMIVLMIFASCIWFIICFICGLFARYFCNVFSDKTDNEQYQIKHIDNML